ncbi:hypothetical protein QZH41_015460 [Actinostola sp. cb2023]|nr:hypothetical protein QZH41_015460 [Actinostola sp. cb2023]
MPGEVENLMKLEKHPPFTLQDLLRMREYCMKTIDGLRGLWLWTITIFSFALFLRGEEPLRLKVKHLKLPPNYDLKSGKLPQRIDVKIPWSKADRRAKGLLLTLWCNPLDAKLCPLSALLGWLLVSGTKSNAFELYTQDSRAEMIKQQHDGNPVNDHTKWMFKAVR